ncbi:hypothetical protein CpecS_0516 [Chlamydia pecorum VR629]|nr:hypothetical protein CpecS_0516 [Chlamydia pecorum VR629]
MWFSSFQTCCQRYPSLVKDRDVMEDFGLQILESGIRHSSVTVRAVSVLAVGLARDFRLEPVLLRGFRDDSVVVRTLALQVAAAYGSERLKREINLLARRDDSVHVRITAYQVAAALHMKELSSWLHERIRNPCIDGEERREAFRVLLTLEDQSWDTQEFQEGLDQALFACEMLLRSEAPKNCSRFLELLSMEHPEVQEAVLFAMLACHREVTFDEECLSRVRNLAKGSPFPKVQLQAAAVLYIHEDPLGQQLLMEGLRSSSSSVCEAASVALCSLGVRAAPLAREALSSVSFRRASANLAVLLLVCREDVENAGDILAEYLENPEMCWAIQHFLWDARWGLHVEGFPLYADLIKREIRKKLIHLLTMAHYSQSRAVATKFLTGQQQGWSFFSGVFWEEGDEKTSEMFSHNDSYLSQFEYALADFGQKKDQESLHALLQFYPKSRWQDKLAILESLAFSENLDALPFLLECCLNESPSLRSAAAGAIFALYK